MKKRTAGYLLQDIGLLALLVCIGAAALSVGGVEAALRAEFSVMLLGMFFAILFAGFKLTSLSVIAAAFQILVYTTYKLYSAFAYAAEIQPICYIWLFLPLLAVAGMLAFIYGSRQTELENEVLRGQVEELVLVNSLTGLYNLRSLYMDLKRQVAYAERNGMSICLMVIKLRYEPELRKVLSRRNYEAMIQKMADIVSDAVRVEDKAYSLDNQGTIGVILTCDEEGSVFVRNRIKANLEKKESFEGIMDHSIRVEVKIACLEYDREAYGQDMILYKTKVENELQYDV